MKDSVVHIIAQFPRRSIVKDQSELDARERRRTRCPCTPLDSRPCAVLPRVPVFAKSTGAAVCSAVCSAVPQEVKGRMAKNALAAGSVSESQKLRVEDLIQFFK